MTNKKVTSFVQESDAEDLLGELDLAEQLPPRIPNLGCAVATAADKEPTRWKRVYLTNRAIVCRRLLSAHM